MLRESLEERHQETEKEKRRRKKKKNVLHNPLDSGYANNPGVGVVSENISRDMLQG